MLRKFLEYMGNMKVRRQLLGIYFIVVLIPILVIGVYLTNMLCNMVVDQSIDEASVNIERIEERLNEKIKIANSVAESLYFDEELMDILRTHYEENVDIYDAYRKYTKITTFLTHYSEISSIRIYTKNQSLLNNSQFIQVTPEIESMTWYQEALERNSYMEWVNKYDEYRKTYNISLIRAIKNRGEILGVLVISLDSSGLRKLIKDEPYETMIMFNGETIASTGKERLSSEYLTHIRLMPDEDGEVERLRTQSVEGLGYIIFSHYTPSKTLHTDIEICMHMAVNDLTKETRNIIAKSFACICLSLCLATLLILIFTKRFSERIILVRKEMAKVVAGNFNISESISGKDEIGELYTDIYKTVQSVQELVKEIYEAKVQKEELKRRQKEMAFEMLASQINPHFLYNTLETIRMRALFVGEAELAKIVKMLSKLLRRNLEVSDKSVTIASELKVMEAYLEIQKFRFGDRISYTIVSEIDGEKYSILPLLLQPIIENAFIHGLEGKVGPGHINCFITAKEDTLHIVIEDDGLGMSTEQLEKLRNYLEDSSEKVGRVGMRNINERIKLYYGEARYGLNIESTLGEGTKVTVILPQILI